MQRFDLKRFRLDRKLTQKELAEILMCKQNYISNIENGIGIFAAYSDKYFTRNEWLPLFR